MPRNILAAMLLVVKYYNYIIVKEVYYKCIEEVFKGL
jgi:hypothetical protein